MFAKAYFVQKGGGGEREEIKRHKKTEKGSERERERKPLREEERERQKGVGGWVGVRTSQKRKNE